MISTSNSKNIENNASPNAKMKRDESSIDADKNGAKENKVIKPEIGKPSLKDVSSSSRTFDPSRTDSLPSIRPRRRAAPTDLREPLLTFKMRRNF